jgi:hypothetical protein
MTLIPGVESSSMGWVGIGLKRVLLSKSVRSLWVYQIHKHKMSTSVLIPFRIRSQNTPTAGRKVVKV